MSGEIIYYGGDVDFVCKIINSLILSNKYYMNYKDIHMCSNYEEFRKVPILTKDKYVDCWDQIRSCDTEEENLLIDYTSGSTGKPTKVARTENEVLKNRLNIWKLRREHYDNVVSCKRVEFARRTKYFIQNPDEIFCIDKNVMYIKGIISKELVYRYMELLEEYQPEFIISAPSFLWELVVIAKEYKPFKFSPKLIECSGEFLFDYMKNEIEKYFQCKVINHYGSSEFWPIAFENKYGELAINKSEVFVEVVDTDKDGYGKILITPLKLKAIPLVRYELGDIGRMLKSNYGDYEYIQMKNAKVTDYAITRDGNKIGGFYFSEIVINELCRNGINGIRSWQIVQENLEQFIVKLCLVNTNNKNIERIIDSNLKKEFGDIDIRFDYVDTIQRYGIGKLKFFINNMN